MMKLLILNLTSLILISLSFNIYANYSSLSDRERKLVTEAFEKSKFYKYYESLVKGKDKITVKNIKKVSEKQDDNIIHYVYEMEVSLIIEDKTFERIAEFEFDMNINTEKFGLNWYTFQEGIKYLGAFLAGLLLGSLGR